MHCEGIMSGELKHGPLAMVDRNLGIVMIICSDNVYKVTDTIASKILERFMRNFIFLYSNLF